MNDERTIFQRMIAILDELPAIGKNQRNEQQRFMFRGHDDVMNELNPLLAKHGVFVVPDVQERIRDHRETDKGKTMYETSLHVRYRFYGLLGDFVEASVWGEGTDMGDKDTNKAMTMAFKNVLAQTFALATQELSDADAETPEQTTRRTAASGHQTDPAASPALPPAGGTAKPTMAQKGFLKNLLTELRTMDDQRDWDDVVTSWLAKEFGRGLEEITRSQMDSLVKKLEKTRDALNEQGVSASGFPPASSDESARALEQAGIGAPDDAPLSGVPAPADEELPSL